MFLRTSYREVVLKSAYSKRWPKMEEVIILRLYPTYPGKDHTVRTQ